MDAGKRQQEGGLPAGWTAAVLTLQASADCQNFGNVYEQNGEVQFLSVAAGQWLLCNPSDFAGMRFLKFRSGTNASPVNQGAGGIPTLVLRGL